MKEYEIDFTDQIKELNAKQEASADDKAGYPPNCNEGYVAKDGKCVPINENEAKKKENPFKKKGDDKKKGGDKKKNGDKKKDGDKENGDSDKKKPFWASLDKLDLEVLTP